TSAPLSANAKTKRSVASSEGSPAVMYATMPSSPRARNSANLREIRLEFEFTAIIFPKRYKCSPQQLLGAAPVYRELRRALFSVRIQSQLQQNRPSGGHR